MSWPWSGDPFYNYNIAENNARRVFYGVNAVPWLEVDGLYQTYFPPFAQFYNLRIGVPTPVSVELSGLYLPTTGEISITATATTTEALPAGDYRLWIALVEDNIFFNGPNTTDLHRHVMRDFNPSVTGTQLTFSGTLPQSDSVDAQFTMDPIFEESECLIVAWVQEYSGKEVYNSEWASVLDFMDLTAVDDTLPAAMTLGHNYPNPFNPSTVIPVSVERAGAARLDIVTPDGRLVRTLLEGDLPAGTREVRWDGTDGAGQPVASGVYLARLHSVDGVQSKRLMLLK